MWGQFYPCAMTGVQVTVLCNYWNVLAFCGLQVILYYRYRYSISTWNRIGVFALKMNSGMLMSLIFVIVSFVPVSHKHRDSAVWLMNHVSSWLSTTYVTVLSMLAYVNMSFSDRNVSLRYAGSQMSDSTRVCAYMYKTVEHLSIHNADDEESSEDYGAADVQVNVLHHRVVVCGPGRARSVWQHATGWMVWGSNPSGGWDFPHLYRLALGSTQPFVQWVLGLSRGVKRLGRGVDHSPPSSAEVMERVEQYLYSPSGPSWPVLGWTLPLLTYLLTPWCRVLLEKLTGLQLVKKFPAFHGTRRFITTLTSVRQLSLSWASPIQSIYPHPTSWWSILILSTHLHLGLPSGLLPSGFTSKTLYTPISSPIRATCPAHLVLLDFTTRTILGEEYRSFELYLYLHRRAVVWYRRDCGVEMTVGSVCEGYCDSERNVMCSGQTAS